jgi:hypothetical protein
LANVAGYIDEFTDVTTGAVNETLTPGGIFAIVGHKIKVFGNDPEVGIYFVSADGAGLRVKVEGRLAENTMTKLIGVIPALDVEEWKMEVKTQYAGSSDTALKTPRMVESAFTLTVGLLLDGAALSTARRAMSIYYGGDAVDIASCGTRSLAYKSGRRSKSVTVGYGNRRKDCFGGLIWLFVHNVAIN